MVVLFRWMEEDALGESQITIKKIISLYVNDSKDQTIVNQLYAELFSNLIRKCIFFLC